MDDTVVLFNGRGGEYTARIERIHKDDVAVSITGFADIERESRLRVMLAQGISSGERMDYTLQKAVELGVTAIQPIAAKRSVVKLAGERADRRVAHWQGVVASACEQCGRNQVPIVATPLTLATGSASMVPDGYCFCRRWPKRDWPTCPPPPKRIAWWPDPKADSSLTKSPPCMRPAPFRSAWDRACCAPKLPHWLRWLPCKPCGATSRACCWNGHPAHVYSCVRAGVPRSTHAFFRYPSGNFAQIRLNR